MLKFGILSPQDAAEVEHGTLVASEVGPASSTSQALGVRAVHQQRVALLRRDRHIPLRTPR